MCIRTRSVRTASNRSLSRPVLVAVPSMSSTRAGGLRSTRECSTELDGVDRDRVALIACGVRAACRAREGERERLAVAPRPLGHDVADDAAVVLGRQRELATRGVRDVDAVHPGIAREDDVEQVAHLPRLRLAPD